MTDTEAEPAPEPLGVFEVRVADPVHDALTVRVEAVDWGMAPDGAFIDFYGTNRSVVYSARATAVYTVRLLHAPA